MADATTAIEGVCVTDITTAVNNTTVAMKLIGYVGGKDHTSATWKVAITGGTITAADEGKYFNLVLATQKVDGATKSTSTGQLRLERFLSATTCLFSISNKGL